ncbi:MAG: zinc ribbon domain-containing protein [Acidobacteriota bacterium]|nr:zinc ribbon domain-containing protein [Acidobacteriota bacterium]
MNDNVQCPKCGHANPLSAYFCVNCHAILIRRCPNCWHEQRQGMVCEKCGTNFALAAELAFEKSQKEEARVERDKMVAEALTFSQIVALPFTSVAGVVRGLLLRVVTGLLSR